MAQLVSTVHSADIPPVPHQGFIADASKPFDTVIIIGYDHSPEQIIFIKEAAQKASRESKNTLIIGDGKSDIPTNHTELLQDKTGNNTQIIIIGHGKETNKRHFIGLVKGQENIAYTVQNIVSISGENLPRRVFIFSCYAEAAKANFLETPSPVEITLEGSNAPTLIGLNLEAISTLISRGYLPHLPPEGGVNQHALYDHVTIIKGKIVTTHKPIALSATMATVSSGLISGGAPQIPAMEILHKRLLLAATHGELEEVQKLLDLRVDPNKARDLLGLNALHLAANCGNPCMTKALLAHGADPNLSDTDGFIPLHFAAQSGRATVAEVLLAHDADPNLQNFEGVTPLHFAAQEGYPTVVVALLANGADPNLSDTDGFTPKDYLEHVENPETQAAIERMLEQAERRSQKKHPTPTTLDDVENTAYNNKRPKCRE